MDLMDKKTILVVEDDNFYGNIYRTKLSKEGFDVTVVGNGDTAIEFARFKRPDLILLDLILPMKDGFEILKELKADDKLKDIKVIVSSNLGQEEDIKRAKDLGASDYFVKTNLSIQEMVDIVKKYLSS